jgi:Trk-type K+ transport system membrane component
MDTTLNPLEHRVLWRVPSEALLREGSAAQVPAWLDAAAHSTKVFRPTRRWNGWDALHRSTIDFQITPRSSDLNAQIQRTVLSIRRSVSWLGI